MAQTSDLAGAIFRPGGLSEVLSKFTGPQLDDLLGKAHADDLRQLARDIDLVQARPGTGGGRNMGVGMAAVSLALHPLSHLKRLAAVYIFGRMLANPAIVRYLALGLRPETQASIGKWARNLKSLIYFGIPQAQHLMMQGMRSANAEIDRTIGQGPAVQ